MSKFLIRYNKARGERGSLEHAWRVFEEEKEYLCKYVKINVPSQTEQSGEDWNITCDGEMKINFKTSTIEIINSKKFS
jgi:hypothetical protein